MRRSPGTIEYAAPTAPETLVVTGASVARFFGGLFSYAAAALLLLRLNTLQWMKALGRVGVGAFHEPILWLIGLSFLAAVVYVQVRWRWTAFTVGVAAGVLLTLVGGGILFLVLMRRMA